MKKKGCKREYVNDRCHAHEAIQGRSSTEMEMKARTTRIRYREEGILG